MDPNTALPQPVIHALARGWVVLTGNQRAARSLRHAFDLKQQAQGLSHWPPPAILAWDSWLTALWHRLLLDGHADELLLNATQEHSLWRGIISADPSASTLRPLDSLAELAAEAWSRLHGFRAHRRLHAAANTTDTRAFARWASEFERRCLQSRYITAAQLPEALAGALAAGQIALPPGLLLIGFDFIAPASEMLLHSATTTGVSIEEPRPSRVPRDEDTESSLLIDAPDPNSELLACAAWLRDRLDEDPDVRLAVIVPDIDAERGSIERAFRNLLAPWLNDIDSPADSGPFEFSLGVSLEHTPIAAAALDILSWAIGPISLDRVSALLLSPYLAGARGSGSPPPDELLARAEFDAFTLRRRSTIEAQIGIDELASLLSRSQLAAQLPGLRAHLRAFSATVRNARLERERSHADWAATFQELLDAAAWAPPARLDSIEFQARRKWESALDELAALDFDPRSEHVSFRYALDALAHIAAVTLFAPESRHTAVQIMGPLEAAGSSFDGIWFLRAGDLTWPPAPATNPLLPYALQREFGMPGGNAIEDTSRALRITQRIAASAPAVIFSYAQQTPAGHQRPSPVLAEFVLEARSTDSIAAQPASVPVALDSLLDDKPIATPPATLRGGAAILGAQAACAFRAFAEHRLFSTSLDQVSLGLDARERGSVVHSVLHDFWAEVRTQQALRAMPTAQRDALLERCIDSALSRPHASSGWAGAYLGTERERLLRLLRPWLDFEANERAPFVVKASEEKLEGVSIGPLRLDVRVDRIDETVLQNPDEIPTEIILDYKTGRADPSEWDGPRPDSPQLPLYAVVSQAPRLAAVAFAGIRPGKFMALSGYQSQQGILPAAKRGQTRDLEVKREEWSQVLTALAEEFHAGRALTLPKDYPETCRYCRQRLFCRLDLSMLASGDESTESEDVTGTNVSAISVSEQEEQA